MNLQKEYLSFKNPSRFENSKLLTLFYSNNMTEPFFCHDLYKLIGYYKGLIDKINNFKKWDYAKKLSNPFELINQGGYKSISSINPISRSYFKLLELINDFGLIKDQDKYSYCGLAEGPGGFVECFIKYRKKMFLGRYDNLICMTLRSDNTDIPNWNKAANLFNNNNVTISYGSDGTGNIYHMDNIIHLRNTLGDNLVDFVTADGGFDYSVDFNHQEQMSSKLIFAEIVCAFNISKLGANFVLKIFDIYTLLTIKLLYLLTLFYDEVSIVKPHTSRPANSEKYVVCKGFRGISDEHRFHFIKMLKEWNSNKGHVSDISGISMPSEFINSLYTLNLKYAKIQISNILKTIVFIERKLNSNDLEYRKHIQTLYSLQWCKKYNNPINGQGIMV